MKFEPSPAFKPLGSGVSRRVEAKDPKRSQSGRKPVFVKKENIALPAHSRRLLDSGYTVLNRDGTSIRRVKSGAITRYVVE